MPSPPYTARMLWIWLAISLIGLLAVAAILLGPVQTWANQRRYPALGRHVDLTEHGVRLHVIEHGPADGIPVLLLHGMFASTYDYTLSPFWDIAAEKYRLIAIDRPGKGYSQRPQNVAYTSADDADVLQAFIEQENIDRPIVLGHSNGAPSALAHAVRHGQFARGYVLLGPACYPEQAYPDASSALVRFVRGVASPVSGPVLSRAVLQMPTWFFRGPLTRHVFVPEKPTEPFKKYAGALTRRPWQIQNEARDLLRIPEALTQLSADYPTITAPCEIIAAEHDTMAPAALHAEPLHAALPGSQLTIVPGAGHMLQVHHPRVVVEAIDRLIEN